jgi:hypothetical protein
MSGKTPGLGFIVLSLSASVLSKCVESVVLVRLWGWHVEPLGLPALDFWAAFGLLVTVFLIAPIALHSGMLVDSVLKPPRTRALDTFLTNFLLCGWLLALGYLAHIAGGAA